MKQKKLTKTFMTSKKLKKNPLVSMIYIAILFDYSFYRVRVTFDRDYCLRTRMKSFHASHVVSEDVMTVTISFPTHWWDVQSCTLIMEVEI